MVKGLYIELVDAVKKKAEVVLTADENWSPLCLQKQDWIGV